MTAKAAYYNEFGTVAAQPDCARSFGPHHMRSEETMDDNELMLMLHALVEAAAKRWPVNDDYELYCALEERLSDVMDERNPQR
jgi:hypothetical protein